MGSEMYESALNGKERKGVKNKIREKSEPHIFV